jgi:catechol 2,3-dioxygenase-like lactoylglutathione lyase family enzyme
MPTLEAIEIKAFVPARDFDLSKRFYADLGFTIEPMSDDMAFVYVGTSSFLLTKFYQKEHAENFMMHLLVPDVEAWWQQVVTQRLPERYGARVTPPEDRPWGLRDFTIVDPTSVLWRIGQGIDVAGDVAPTSQS